MNFTRGLVVRFGYLVLGSGKGEGLIITLSIVRGEFYFVLFLILIKLN